MAGATQNEGQTYCVLLSRDSGLMKVICFQTTVKYESSIKG